MTRKEKEEELILLEELQRRREKKDYSLFAPNNIFITDKKGKVVNLVPNNIQKQINDKIDQLKAEGKPPKIIVLKARQEGVSTNVQGRFIHHTTTKKNRNALVVAHMDKSTRAIFEKAKFMNDRLPDKPLQKASNATELIFDTPSHYKGNREGLNSKIVVQVAGSSSIGRSETYHYVHLSEFAFWEGKDDKSPLKQLAGILQSVPDELDTEVIIESTANGYNDFKAVWDDAVAGKNGFTPMFFSWFDHDEYILPLTCSEEHFKATMSEYELYLYNQLKLPLERINWWRWALKNKCNGDLNMMKQENPSTPEEAFIMSGTSVYDNEKIIKRIEYLRRNNPLITEGYFSFEWNNPEWQDFIKLDTIKFVESKQKPFVRIYEYPKKDYPYVLGGDTKGEGKDVYTGTLKNNVTQMRCATLEMQLNNSKPYTWQMFCLGYYYNKALIGIEMNFNTAPLEELERLKYSKQYVREVQDAFTGQLQKKFGWKTDGITRPRMIDNSVALTESHLELYKDIRTLQQMITFVLDKNNRPDALSGEHDDLLFSDMICDEISNQQTTRIAKKEVFDLSKLPQDLQEDYRGANKEGKAYLKAKWIKMGLFE